MEQCFHHSACIVFIANYYQFFPKNQKISTLIKCEVFKVSCTFIFPQSQSPVFLLFLECVWQLVQQHSAAFQFSETYLTVLSDSVYVPVFSTFLFNSAYQRESTMKVVYIMCTDSVAELTFQLTFAWMFSSALNQLWNLNSLAIFKDILAYKLVVLHSLLTSWAEWRLRH